MKVVIEISPTTGAIQLEGKCSSLIHIAITFGGICDQVAEPNWNLLSNGQNRLSTFFYFSCGVGGTEVLVTGGCLISSEFKTLRGRGLQSKLS